MDLMPVCTMNQRQHRNEYADSVAMRWPSTNNCFDADSSLGETPSKSLLPKFPRARKSSNSTAATTRKGNVKSQSKPAKRGAFSKLSRVLFRERDPNVTFSRMNDSKESKELETSADGEEVDHKKLMTTTIDTPVQGYDLTSSTEISSRWLAGHEGDFNFQADFSQCDSNNNNNKRTKTPACDASPVPSPLSKFTLERVEARSNHGDLSPSPAKTAYPSIVHGHPSSPAGRKTTILSEATPLTQAETPNHSATTSMEHGSPRKSNRMIYDELKNVQLRLVDRLESSPGGSKRVPISPDRAMPILKPPRYPSTPLKHEAILERLEVAAYMNDKGDVVDSGSELHLKLLERLENTSDEQLEAMHTQDPSFSLNADQQPEVAVAAEPTPPESTGGAKSPPKLASSALKQVLKEELYSDPLLSGDGSRHKTDRIDPTEITEKPSTLSDLLSNEGILSDDGETKSTATGTETKSYFSFPAMSAAGETTDRGFRSMSEALMDLVSNTACGVGGQAEPLTKDSIREKVVALEAGWNGFRETLNEKILEVEDSLKGITIGSLLPFSTEEGDEDGNNRDFDNDSDIYAPRVQTVSEDTATELSVQTSFSESRRTYDSKASTAMASKTTVTRAEDEMLSDEEIVLEILKDLETNRGMSSQDNTERTKHIISIEHDVHPLQSELADISIIVDQKGNSSPGGQNNSSREDSEGGKVIMDPKEWDPVVDSPEAMEPWKLDITDPIHNGSSKPGSSLRSPTSVVGGV